MLEKIGLLFHETRESEIPLGEDGGQLGFIAGVINREKVNGFERMIWIVSRGNVFVRRADIEDPFEDPQSASTFAFSNLIKAP